MNPYREPGRTVAENPKYNIFPFHEKYACPACDCGNRQRLLNGKEVINPEAFFGCCGKKTIFGKYKCPPIIHVHVTCWACKLDFLMYGKKDA